MTWKEIPYEDPSKAPPKDLKKNPKVSDVLKFKGKTPTRGGIAEGEGDMMHRAPAWLKNRKAGALRGRGKKKPTGPKGKPATPVQIDDPMGIPSGPGKSQRLEQGKKPVKVGRGPLEDMGGPVSGPDFQNRIYKEKLWEDQDSDFYKAVMDRYRADRGPNAVETMDMGFDPASGFRGSSTFLSWIKSQPEYQQHVQNRINAGRYNPDSPYNDPFWGAGLPSGNYYTTGQEAFQPGGKFYNPNQDKRGLMEILLNSGPNGPTKSAW